MRFNLLKQRFSVSSLVNFFLVCAFPFHLWKIIMLIRDVGWVTERAGTGSFFGLSSLALLYALAESILFFAALLILGLLIPWRWPAKRVYSILGFIALWAPVWDILVQVYRGTIFQHPDFLFAWLFATGHPLRYGYLLLIGFTLIMFAITAGGIWLVSFNQKVQQGIDNFLGRVATLSALYLALDVAAFVILVIRITG
jgi:hypothetical protein